MRNTLLTGVAAAALSLSIAGAIAQDSQRNNPAAAQGATSASPMSEGAKSEGSRGAASSRGEERSAQGQRASEGAGREGAGRNASENAASAPRNDSAKTDGAKTDGARTDGAKTNSAASDSNAKDRPSASAAAAERKTDSKESAQRAEPKGADAKAAETNNDRSNANRNAATGSERSGASTSATSTANERNNASTATGRDADAKSNAAAQDKSNNAATTSGSMSRDSAATSRTGADNNRTTASTSETNVQVRGELNIDRQQASRVHDRLIRESNSSETNININVDVGGRVPDRVRLRPVPRDIVEISPRFRDYEYTVVRDEIIIVEPKTKKVVQIISGGNRGGGSKHVVRLDTKQRDLVKRDVLKTRTGASRASDLNIQLREGVEIPDRVTLQTFPEDLWRDAPELREVRYVIIDQDVVLVDPDTREIIEVIR